MMRVLDCTAVSEAKRAWISDPALNPIKRTGAELERHVRVGRERAVERFNRHPAEQDVPDGPPVQLGNQRDQHNTFCAEGLHKLRLDGAVVNSDVFKTLGVGPAVGRGFTAEDDRDGAPNVVLLSNNLAITLFGRAAGAIGRALLDNQAYTVIGVMPQGFAFPSRDAKLWRPLRFSPALLSLRRNHILDVVARLAPGVSVEEARADLDLVAEQLERAHPKDNAGVGASVVEMRDVMSPQSRMLVLAEVAGTVTLLVAAGLLVKALWRVQAVHPGFRAESVLTLRTALPMPKYSAAATRRDFYSRVLTEARALPGVTSVAYTTALPMAWGAGIFPVTVPGIVDDPASAPRASIRFVTPDFFATLGIPLRRGRNVSDRDDATAPFVAVISESLAQRLWPGQDPIGRQLNVARFDRTVVGVVGDIAVRGLERVSEPQTYFPVHQIGTISAFYAPQALVVARRAIRQRSRLRYARSFMTRTRSRRSPTSDCSKTLSRPKPRRVATSWPSSGPSRPSRSCWRRSAFMGCCLSQYRRARRR